MDPTANDPITHPTIAEEPQAGGTAGALGAFAAVSAWSVGNVLIAGGPITGLTLATYRLWIGAALFLVVALFRRRPLRWADLGRVLPGALAFAGDIGLFFLAVTTTSVAIAVTMSALQPIGILLVGLIVFGERVRGVQWGLTLVAVVGTAIVVFGAGGAGPSSWQGNLWAFLALITWIAYFVASKQARRHIDTLSYLTWLNLIAAMVITPVAAVTGGLHPSRDITWSAMGFALSIAVIPGGGHLLMNWAHGHTTLFMTSLMTLIMPVASALLAAWWLDQRVSALQVAGMVITLVALAGLISSERNLVPAGTPPDLP